MAGALAGLRVLDAATLLAAPLITAVLADHGADVVRLEPPGGDPYRESARHLWALTGRGKRSLVLDLETAEDRRRLHAAIGGIDVIVVNEPAARLQRRGLDHETLAALHAGLIYVHVSGFGLDGPAADFPGNGTLAEAYSGLTHMTGDPDGPPVLPSVPLGDAVTAYVGAFGILAAWHQRQQNGGAGQIVDVNPVDAMLHMTAPILSGFDESTSPHRLGSRLPGVALRNVFATGDGGWVAVSASTSRQERSVRELVGAAASETPEVALRRWAAERPRDQVLAAMVEARIPVASVNTAHDLIADPHLRYRNAIRSLRHHDGNPVRVPAPAPRLLSGAGHPSDQLAAIGEHTAEVLEQWHVAAQPNRRRGATDDIG
ncbi:MULTISPECIES: CaiB/BaiF CoA transferase family protein [Mycolicibacter]|uniref:CoA transferase n=1 Tax=Mycolicibacter kumamotonensis TaxID=354243 RepID=A0A7K3L6I3_9MYCO|nr:MULTISPECIES: CoA transferase [Mycolicibacter]NDJ88008.1 CoA transferase [Mycolicibacter kumamotonensis]RAV02823.1 CoA transferase [Mycolicibacter senuensis]